jgi:competence protein ComEC
VKPRTALVALALSLPFAPLLTGADTLEIYVLDMEGGKAMIVRGPAGETMMVDGGTPGQQNDRDLKRVLAAAQELGIKQFDVVLVTHYDIDHAGNVPAIAAHIPGKLYVDHGAFVDNPKIGGFNRKAGDDYLAFVADKKRISVKPGDMIPMKGVKITVVASREQVLSKALKGAGKANAACPAAKPEPAEIDDNSGSIGTIWDYGKFRMGDFGDLLAWVEYNLACPNNLIGNVDLFMVNHHGLALSNSPAFVAALSPKVAIMNNGERKGGAPEVLKTLRGSGRFEDLWQLHYSAAAKDANAPEDFIANLKAQGCAGSYIKVSARRDGSFTLTNGRNGFSKTYRSGK